MFTEERQAAIIQCLQEKGKVKVSPSVKNFMYQRTVSEKT